MRSVTALVLAGSRPGRDPLLEGNGVSTKAVLPVAGQPMLTYPLAALSDVSAVGHLLVYAQRPDEVEPVLAAFPQAKTHMSLGSIAATVERALLEQGGPLLVTTADNALLTAEMVNLFLAQAKGADVAVALVEKRVVEEAGYESRRTWLRFRSGAWSGANLFWLAGPQCLPLIRFWASIEQERKKGWRIISAFGPLLALRAALRLADIHTLVRQAGRRFGVAAKVVALPQAEACIDADKPSDIILIERILAERQAQPASS